MAKYTGYRYGGCPIWKIGGRHYKLLSKHKTMRNVKEADRKRDNCDKVQKVGQWYGRFNKLPTDVARRLSSQ